MLALVGESARWGATEHLLATVIDSLGVLNTNIVQSRSKHRIRPPKPIKRPGDTPKSTDKVTAGRITRGAEVPGSRVLGRGKGIPIAEMRERMARKRRSAPAEEGTPATWEPSS